MIQPLVQINEVDLMIMGNITLKSGYKMYGNNMAIALFSAFEYKSKLIHGKILEIKYPADPEYFEEEIYEEETDDEETDEEEIEEEEMDEEETDDDEEEIDDDEEEQAGLLGEDENLVSINLIDLDQI